MARNLERGQLRKHFTFDVGGASCTGTLDEARGKTALLIVSGGNEIRSGAHGGQAALARQVAEAGFPVFRYDRRGIGDSEGNNLGFEESRADIAAALSAFRAAAPDVERVVAFGNCDAATALACFHHEMPIDALVLANPWVIEVDRPDTGNGAPSRPNAAAIRARYWERLKNPRSLIDLFSGKINLRKLAGGLLKASKKDTPSGLAMRLANALNSSKIPACILLAKRDSTALAFNAAWKNKAFDHAHQRPDLRLVQLDSASHSFANAKDKAWLFEQIMSVLVAEEGHAIGDYNSDLSWFSWASSSEYPR